MMGFSRFISSSSDSMDAPVLICDREHGIQRRAAGVRTLIRTKTNTDDKRFFQRICQKNQIADAKHNVCGLIGRRRPCDIENLL